MDLHQATTSISEVVGNCAVFIGGAVACLFDSFRHGTLASALVDPGLGTFILHSLIGGAIALAVKVSGEWIVRSIFGKSKKREDRE
jgi:hypothetical protein